jgi:hypothetical protein
MVKITDTRLIADDIHQTDYQPKSVEVPVADKLVGSVTVEALLAQKLRSTSSLLNGDNEQADAIVDATNTLTLHDDRSALNYMKNAVQRNQLQVTEQSFNRSPDGNDRTTDILSKVEPEASTVTDKGHKNIAAMLSKRVTNNSQSTERESEPSSAEEKKGILSSLLSRRKANEESAKESKSHSHSSKKQEKSDQSTTSDTKQLALKDDPLYQKYLKMLKIGMPMDVVKHALLRDGLDPSVMDGDLDKPATIIVEGKGIPLKDDPRYAKYFKMLKMGLPMGAVKNAMIRDGEDPDVMDGDHNAPAKSKIQNTLASAPKEKDKFRRARVHWDSKGKVSSRSVWAIVKQDLEVDSIEIDDKEFESLFQAEIGSIGKTDHGSRGKESSSKKSDAVKVIDPKRANNGGIVLARLKMSYDELATAVDSMYVHFDDNEFLVSLIASSHISCIIVTTLF